MISSELTIGDFVCIEKPQLQTLIDRLIELGYRTIGPQISDGAIVYDDLHSVSQIPVGFIDQQKGGEYRLKKSGSAWFDYVVGPHSLKNFVFPPTDPLLRLERVGQQWKVEEPETPTTPIAVIGPRGCDLHALQIQDRVFMGDAYVDPAYQARRENLFILAVNCRRSASTCFCHSMDTGPSVPNGFDLALTELDQHFVIQVGTAHGLKVIETTEVSLCSEEQQNEATAIPQRLRKEMESGSKHLDTTDIRDLLLGNLDHPRWQEVADRCLSCANCTMACPTCFCSSVEEVTDLTGDHVTRQREWGSCFTSEHSYMSSGTVRKTTASRYRQWMTHKLATWFDQFDTSGCVGCGRCITWCPVGIDLTEEVAAIRESDGRE